MTQRVPEGAIALERLLRRRRELGNNLLNIDMQERWGSDAQKAEARRDGLKLGAEAREVDAELEALAAATWRAEPDATRAWAAAHVTLLDRFLAETDDDVGRNVATEERGQWQEVARGERSCVRGNVFYVRFDPALYEELFGFAA